MKTRKFQCITLLFGGPKASGFGDGGCWRTRRPVFPNKNGPGKQGPSNLKFSNVLSTDSEI